MFQLARALEVPVTYFFEELEEVYQSSRPFSREHFDLLTTTGVHFTPEMFSLSQFLVSEGDSFNAELVLATPGNVFELDFDLSSLHSEVESFEILASNRERALSLSQLEETRLKVLTSALQLC